MVGADGIGSATARRGGRRRAGALLRSDLLAGDRGERRGGGVVRGLGRRGEGRGHPPHRRSALLLPRPGVPPADPRPADLAALRGWFAGIGGEAGRVVAALDRLPPHHHDLDELDGRPGAQGGPSSSATRPTPSPPTWGSGRAWPSRTRSGWAWRWPTASRPTRSSTPSAAPAIAGCGRCSCARAGSVRSPSCGADVLVRTHGAAVAATPRRPASDGSRPPSSPPGEAMPRDWPRCSEPCRFDAGEAQAFDVLAAPAGCARRGGRGGGRSRRARRGTGPGRR